MINERTAKVIAVTTMPATVSYEGKDHNCIYNSWKHTAMKFVITDQANPFLVQYITHTIRG